MGVLPKEQHETLRRLYLRSVYMLTALSRG